MYIYICTGIRPFRAWAGPAGRMRLPGHSQSLTLPVEVGYFPGAAVGNPKSNFPRQRLGSSRLAQSGLDCAQKGMSISSVVVFQFRENKSYEWEIRGYSVL